MEKETKTEKIISYLRDNMDNFTEEKGKEIVELATKISKLDNNNIQMTLMVASELNPSSGKALTNVLGVAFNMVCAHGLVNGIDIIDNFKEQFIKINNNTNTIVN